MYVVILANNTREAMRYAKGAKLPRGRFRYAAKASTIRGLKTAEIHILPGFKKRLDRHAILNELRYTKAKTLEVTPEHFSQLLTAYPLERAATIAARYLAVSNALDTAEPVEEQIFDTELVAAKRTRRSRCKVCNELVLGDDDPAHDDLAHIQADPVGQGQPARESIPGFF